jgi:REP element-mobilizing transposase RayT
MSDRHNPFESGPVISPHRIVNKALTGHSRGRPVISFAATSHFTVGFSSVVEKAGPVEKAADYQAFEQELRETLDESLMRICAYTVMPNHWHLLLWPECDGELAQFMQRLTMTHVRRWPQHRGNAGLGHLYEGRYESFPVESDEHFRVVARNAGTNQQPPTPRERRSSPRCPFPGAVTEISRKKGCRRDAEELGELEDLPLGERSRSGQDG